MFYSTILGSLLDVFGIPVHEFGKGEAKKLIDLLNEINKGECELIISRGSIHRKISVLRIKVIYNNLILKEVEQVFSDGREPRKRGYLWVSEKISSLEDKEDALKRALAEELGIKSKVVFSHKGEEKKVKYSPSYPELKTEYAFINYEVTLNAQQFKKDGYVEKEGSTRLTTYFEWVENTESN